MRILDAEPDDDLIESHASTPGLKKEPKRRRSSERVTSSDKSVLLLMYGREIAPLETPAFTSKVGEIIARATKTPQKQAAG